MHLYAIHVTHTRTYMHRHATHTCTYMHRRATHTHPSPGCEGQMDRLAVLGNLHCVTDWKDEPDRARRPQVVRASSANEKPLSPVSSLPQCSVRLLRGTNSPRGGRAPRPFLEPQLTKLCSAPSPQIGEPQLVICMDCSADTMTNRLLQRSQSSQRGEDGAKSIAKRLEAYHRASIPVIAYYETKTQLQKASVASFK